MDRYKTFQNVTRGDARCTMRIRGKHFACDDDGAKQERAAKEAAGDCSLLSSPTRDDAFIANVTDPTRGNVDAIVLNGR